MQQVNCSQCGQLNQVPDDIVQAHCMRCGQWLTGASDAIQSERELPMTIGGKASVGLPQRYESWDEFRALSPAVQRELTNLATRALPDLRRVHVQPVPSEAPAELDGWGRPLGTMHLPGESLAFRHFGAWIIIGVGIVMTFTGGLRTIDILVEREGRHLAGGLIAFAIGVATLAGGLWYGYLRRAALASVVWIFEEGVCVLRGGQFMITPWNDVVDFAVANPSGRPVYWLSPTEEMSFRLDMSHDPNMMPLMEYVEIRLASAQLLKRLEAIMAGRQIRFGAIALDRNGLSGPHFFAPWESVRKVVADANHLLIDWSQRSQWMQVEYDRVSFPLLVRAIASVLIEEHGRLKTASVEA